MVILREGVCPGINEEFIKALQSEDIKTVEDFVSCNPEELAQKCSLSYKALVAVRRVLLAQYTAFPVSGADLYEELLSSTAILSTGNPSLDKLLDSGLYTGEITELAGSPGSGKSQVCFSVAVNISHQLKQTVFYIDTKGGMCANRLLQMLQSKTPNMEEQMEALQKIKVLRVFDVFSLLACLQNLRSNGLQKASVGGGSVKALMVDSVSAVLSSMLGGKQNEDVTVLLLCIRYVLADASCWGAEDDRQRLQHCCTGNKPCDQRWKWAFEGWTRTVMESCAAHSCAPAENRGCRDFILTNRNSDQIITTGLSSGRGV
ncbi:DNA repair protein RAD51 homolog 4 isoform X2 [Sinocyclocheilus grahami]|uniref:DNA repair protein RAD51 homolog 4 isoform X2 n=1 Tax=Sinocyclocheilus grahami TaxID=75366 RepID=UPI0007AC792D|nr:PREDICTED: DNA repair protein RAD51 homolog 4-like isoform X2 [Sinocyclocheilus grahami]